MNPGNYIVSQRIGADVRGFELGDSCVGREGSGGERVWGLGREKGFWGKFDSGYRGHRTYCKTSQMLSHT